MSGICGFLHLDNQPASNVDLDLMLAKLAHRGPDDYAGWISHHIGLGHRMLWTTPESRDEHLPLRQGDCVITADMRLDNRAELLTQLSMHDPDVGDSAIIVAAYQKWGEACVEHLAGDFAFALWDDQQQRLICARDHMGIRPFYYYRSNQLFAFASEIKALLALPHIPQRLNKLQIAYHLVGTLNDTSITYYEDIQRLPAAHTMIVSRGGARLQRYWMPDARKELRLRSDSAYVEAFREVFSEAVRCRLRSAFPVGSTLSGGLDSSSIACTAAHLTAGSSNNSIPTFSAIFPDLPETDLQIIDERVYIQAVLAKGNFEPHFVNASRLSPLTDVDRMIEHLDGTFLAPNLYLHWALYGAAHDAGVRLFLDGVDGDTTISHGWEFLSQLALTGHWLRLIQEVTDFQRNARFPVSRRQLIWSQGFQPLIPETFVQRWAQLRGQKPKKSWEGMSINPEFARYVELDRHLEALENTLPSVGYSPRQKHRAGMLSPLYAPLLEMASKAAAAFAVEPAYPFFDRRLMEFCLALPADQKFSQGWTRSILRRGMEGILPDQVRWRPGKSNLEPNFKRRLLDCESDKLDAMIANPGNCAPYFNLAVIQEEYKRLKSRATQGEDYLTRVYGPLMLWLWVQQPEIKSALPG